MTDSSATALRRALDAFLREAPLSSDERYDLLLAACEAATNAIDHPRKPTKPCFEVLAEIGDTGVTITVHDHGQWGKRCSGEHRGRGLAMMRILADTTIATGRHGTTVTVRSHARLPVVPHGERGTSRGSAYPRSAVGA